MLGPGSSAFSIPVMGDSPKTKPDAGELDLLLYAPCPVKLVVRDALQAIADAETAQARPMRIDVPMGCTSIEPFDPLYMETDPERLPGLIASIGFGDFWRREFVERFLDPGVYEAKLPATVNPLHTAAGLVDPAGKYLVYGVTPYIFLVDKTRLGGLPVPRVWADLLDPKYRGKIVLCGDGDDLADAVILNLYKEFGLDGLSALAQNAKGVMHSAKMAKIGGTPDDEAGAVFIIPAFFGESTRESDQLALVWPEDGAAASPLYALFKKSEHERLAPLMDFFLHGFGEVDSARWFVPVDGSRNYGLPQHAKLTWIGWDFVRDNDVNRLRDELNLQFRAMIAK